MTYLTPNEVAGLLRLSKMSVYRLIHEGAIPAIKVGRVYRVLQVDLDQFIKDSVVTKEME